MSEKSTTEAAPDRSGQATKTVRIPVDTDRADEILQSFDVPVPEASELDEIHLVITQQK